MSDRDELAGIIATRLDEMFGVHAFGPASQDLLLADAILVWVDVKRSDAEAQAYAKVIKRIELGTPYMVNEKYVAGANWVRSQIEDVLQHRPETNL